MKRIFALSVVTLLVLFSAEVYASSKAFGINDYGDVVGVAKISGYGHAFLSTIGVAYDLGTLGGKTSEAQDINDHGQVVGTSAINDRLPVPNYHAFIYSDGLMRDIGTLGGNYSYAEAINNHGQIVGNSTNSAGRTHAFLYSNGLMTDIGTSFPGSSYANDINNSGQIVGTYSNDSLTFEPRAYLYSNGVMTDLGSLGNRRTYAEAINNIGQVVGYSGDRAYLYFDGVMQNLGTLGGHTSQAYGINDLGMAVGWSEHERFGQDRHAFLYADGQMLDLNDLISPDSGWILKEAYAINNHGQIVGYGMNPDREETAFVLSLDLPTPTVPIPGAVWLLGSGLVGLVGLRKKLQKN